MANNKRKAALLLLISVLASLILVGCSKGEDYCVYYADYEIAPENAYYVELKVADYDDPIILLLDRGNAPDTVDNFVSLVERGYYDGLTFHRVEKDFMIQGGDGSHLPEDQRATEIFGEFLANGWPNEIEHKRGVISMARSADYDSATSGFFICTADKPNIDGEYAAFGFVISGLNTVDKIVTRTMLFTKENGQITDKSRQPVIEYIKILEDYTAK